MFDSGWTNYCTAFAVFFASHMILVRPPVRPLLVRHLGERGFQAGYSLLSIGILYWLIDAAQTAPYIELWPWAEWQNWAPIISMGPMCLILALAIGTPNPFSFGGWKNDNFNAHEPGIVRWMRHPILVALFLWSAAHIVPNGNLAHVVLFGTFALFSLLGMRIIDRRQKRVMGETWSVLQRQTNEVPLTQAVGLRDLAIRSVIGALIYSALAHLHPLITGVFPFA
ncbi:MAG: NnrU family protein [Roseibium sp.]